MVSSVYVYYYNKIIRMRGKRWLVSWKLSKLNLLEDSTNNISTEDLSVLSNEINLISMQRVIEIYKQTDEKKVWRSTGKIVGLEMLGRNWFEHLCHSFVLGIKDENWLGFFLHHKKWRKIKAIICVQWSSCLKNYQVY